MWKIPCISKKDKDGNFEFSVSSESDASINTAESDFNMPTGLPTILTLTNEIHDNIPTGLPTILNNYQKKIDDWYNNHSKIF